MCALIQWTLELDHFHNPQYVSMYCMYVCMCVHDMMKIDFVHVVRNITLLSVTLDQCMCTYAVLLEIRSYSNVPIP